MIYDSVTSGIEAATVAWHPLGWTPGWFSEIAKFPCRVLQHHYPHVPNYGNMRSLIKNPKIYDSAAALLVGGTPCQDFSIAGLRAGMSGKNGNLTLEFCRLLIARKYRWFVWENVPGVHSSFSNEAAAHDGVEGRPGDQTAFEGATVDDVAIWQTSDFATLLTAFRQCGYSCAWRVLDAQYFGVPQRRRRVFVVGYLGDDWRPPAAVLFEPPGSDGHPAPVQQEGQTITGALTSSSGSRGSAQVEKCLSYSISSTITAAAGRRGGAGIDETLVTNTLTGSGTKLRVDDQLVVMASGQASAKIDYNLAPTLGLNESPIIMETFQQSQHVSNVLAPALTQSSQLITGTLAAGAHPGGFNGQDISNGLFTINEEAKIRRLTPLEWERLQGFPDYYTDIPGATDSPRYQALGNSMAVPVMRWIGKRIDTVDKIFNPHLYAKH